MGFLFIYITIFSFSNKVLTGILLYAIFCGITMGQYTESLMFNLGIVLGLLSLGLFMTHAAEIIAGAIKRKCPTAYGNRKIAFFFA